MRNTLIGIDSSSSDGPISVGQSSKFDENSIVYVMTSLPEEILGLNQAFLDEFYSSACNLQESPKSSMSSF